MWDSGAVVSMREGRSLGKGVGGKGGGAYFPILYVCVLCRKKTGVPLWYCTVLTSGLIQKFHVSCMLWNMQQKRKMPNVETRGRRWVGRACWRT